MATNYDFMENTAMLALLATCRDWENRRIEAYNRYEGATTETESNRLFDEFSRIEAVCDALAKVDISGE